MKKKKFIKNFRLIVALLIFLCIGLNLSATYDELRYGEFYRAIRSNDMQTVNKILKEEPDIDMYINYPDIAGYTFLMYAITSNFLDEVKVLVSNGALINICDYRTVTPLMRAATRNESFEIVEYLLENGAAPHTLDYRGDNALMYAAHWGAVENMELLLKNGLFIEHRNNLQRTPLIQTLLQECHEMDFEYNIDELNEMAFRGIKFLIEQGAEVNVQDYEGMTPLMFAVYNGHVEAVKLLLENGADKTIKNNFGDDASMFIRDYYCISGVDSTLANLFDVDLNNYMYSPKRRSQWEKDSDLRLAVRECNIEQVRKLLAEGADANSYYPQEDISVMGHAVRVGCSLEILLLLVENGASVNGFYYYEIPPLKRAIMEHNYAAVEYFISRGADVNARNGYDTAAMIFAAETGDIEMIKLLVKYGADINIISHQRTPLSVAIEYEHWEAVEFLKSLGAKE